MKIESRLKALESRERVKAMDPLEIEFISEQEEITHPERFDRVLIESRTPGPGGLPSKLYRFVRK